ncbi:hypothetical protein BRADI_4g17405v3 [Brachypodium distachyon]|uniref:Transposase (putative) gypsy type domain-containing protein n=1 Tax=Brachypodium distachyon TaxID=15368 RepID=A0A0Q3IQ59_BRADI|nr:hypothetical protein BRADI_4g17405v3 [Brachypodium distachyon]
MGRTKVASSKTDAGKGDAGKGAIPWLGVINQCTKILELQDEGLLPGGPDRVRFPAKEEYPRPVLGERVIFIDYALRGLSFPLHAFFHAMLLAYGMQLHDLPPTPICTLRASSRRQKADAVESVNFQVRYDAKYFSLQQRESMESWRSKWLYVQNEASGADPNLPAFSIKKKAASLMARMHSLMGQGLTGIHLMALFLRMRIQPLQARVHPMWSYEGLGDPTRVNAEELSSEEVESWVRRLTNLTGAAPCEIDTPVIPHGPDRPREDGLKDPLSQPPPAGEEELADESSESPDQAIEPAGSDPKASGPLTIIETVEPQVAMHEVASPASGDHQLQELPHSKTRLESSRAERAPSKTSSSACHVSSELFLLNFCCSFCSPGGSVSQMLTPPCSQPIVRSIIEFVDQFEEAVPEPDQLRRELEQSQQELRFARDLLSQANSLKDAAELQSKNLEKKLADLARESAEKVEAEKRLAQDASDAILAKEAEKEKSRAAQLSGVIGPLAGNTIVVDSICLNVL